MMLIPLILLIILVLTSKEFLREYFSKGILQKLQVDSGLLSKNTRNVLFFLVLILFIIALSRPVTNKTEHNVKQKLIPIVIALDVSKSMKAADIYPDRISLAKQKLKAIINKGENTTIGIILFAKDAFILSPVTEDFTSLNYITQNIDTSFNFPNGSNIFATLESTKFMLDEFKVKNLIILSDGGNSNKYTKEIEFAKDENIAVYSIGLATKEGAAIPNGEGYLTDKDGNIVTVKLNDSIKNLSLSSGGGYIDYTLDNSDVDAILNRIYTQSKKEDISNQNIVTYTELFYYPLGLGIFLLLLAFSSITSLKKQTKAAVLVAGIFSLNPVSLYSFEFDFTKIEKAKEHYENKEYTKAADKYRELGVTPQSLYNMANALYKNGQYQEAIDTYSKVVSEDKDLEANKLHNMGNSYVKQNKLDKAKELYEKSLKIKEDKQTKENLDRVKKELEKQKKKQNQQNNKQKNSKDKKQNQDKNSSKDGNKKQNDSKKEDKDKKEQNSQKDSKKDSQNESKEKKGESSKKQEDQNGKSSNPKEYKQQEISDMEEEKWMKHLQGQKAPIFIQKAPTTNKGKQDETPW